MGVGGFKLLGEVVAFMLLDRCDCFVNEVLCRVLLVFVLLSCAMFGCACDVVSHVQLS